jgi:hypothetical protein
MKNKFHLILIFTFLSFNIQPLTLEAQSECKEVLKVAYDYQTITKQEDQETSFVNWFKQKQFSSFESAKKESAEIKLPLEKLISGMGYSKDEKGWSQFRNIIENYSKETRTSHSNFTSVFKTVNDEVVKAWEECMKDEGTHIWIIQRANPMNFTLMMKSHYISGSYPVVENINGLSGKVIKENGTFFDENGTLKMVKIGEGLLTQSFTRIDSTGFTIDIQARFVTNNEPTGGSLELHEIKKLVPCTNCKIFEKEGGEKKWGSQNSVNYLFYPTRDKVIIKFSSKVHNDPKNQCPPPSNGKYGFEIKVIVNGDETHSKSIPYPSASSEANIDFGEFFEVTPNVSNYIKIEIRAWNGGDGAPPAECFTLLHSIVQVFQ